MTFGPSSIQGNTLCYRIRGIQRFLLKIITHLYLIIPPPLGKLLVSHVWPSLCSCLYSTFLGGLLGGFCVSVLVAQLCPTLCDPVDCSPPGSSVHEVFQARILEWVATSFSKGSSQPRDQTRVSCTAGRFFTDWATREALSSRGKCFIGLWLPFRTFWCLR